MPFFLHRLRRHASSLLAHLLPASCALCGATDGTPVCGPCHAQFFRNIAVRCAQCGARLPQDAAPRCGTCLHDTPSFDATIVAADYAPPLDQLVLGLKFGNRLAHAGIFAQALHAAAQRVPSENRPTILTAVPIGAQRLVERGFNQALEIARPLSRALGIPLETHLLARVRETRAQSMLPHDDRQQNVRGAFLVPVEAMARIRGQHVGVVDDVITTGATLNEVAATLKRFGATRVTNFTFARPLHH